MSLRGAGGWVFPRCGTIEYVVGVTPATAFMTPQVEDVKNRNEKICAYLDFPLNKTDILEDFRNNAAELYKIKEGIDVLKRDSFDHDFRYSYSWICITGGAVYE